MASNEEEIGETDGPLARASTSRSAPNGDAGSRPRLRDEHPPDLLEAIGALTVAAGRAETMSRTLLRLLAQLEYDIHAHLTAAQGWAWVVDRLATLAAHRDGLDDEFREDAAEWVRQIRDLRRERNRIIHGPLFRIQEFWQEEGRNYASPPKWVLLPTPARRARMELEYHELEVDELWDLALRLEDAAEKAAHLADRVRQEVGDPTPLPWIDPAPFDEDEFDGGEDEQGS